MSKENPMNSPQHTAHDDPIYFIRDEHAMLGHEAAGVPIHFILVRPNETNAEALQRHRWERKQWYKARKAMERRKKTHVYHVDRWITREEFAHIESIRTI